MAIESDSAGGARSMTGSPGRRESAWVAAQVFIANRLVLLIISYLTARLFYDVLGRSTSLYALWHRWDVLWFVRLADHGYVWVRPPVQSDLAFFPLYPLLMHILSVITPLSAYAGGLVISGVSFALALYLLHRLVLHDCSPDVAERTVTYVGLFPTALFFFTAYSEALYLLCSVACFYALRLRRWWLAGLCGMAAVLTRQIGILLLVPCAVEVYGYVRHRERLAPAEWARVLGACALIPAGLVLFWCYLQVRLGDGLLFLKAQSAWQRSFAAPWKGPLLEISHAIHLGGNFSEHTREAEQALSLIHVASLTLFLALIVYGARRLPLSYTAYAVSVMLAILASPATGHGQPLALLSITRFEATLFPPLVALGQLGRSRSADRLVLSLSVALLALFTIIFVRGRWIA